MNKLMLPKRKNRYSMSTEEMTGIMDQILDSVESRDNTIKYLREENEKLKNEAYKDEELQKMQEKLKRTSDALANSFQVSKKEWDKINEWKKQHEADVHGLHTLKERLGAHGAVGGGYTYEFYPTSIATFGVVKCDRCGEKFQFQQD